MCFFNYYFFVPRENVLVLDIFFEALNYEKIEQKKAYEIAGLLGERFSSLPGSLSVFTDREETH